MNATPDAYRGFLHSKDSAFNKEVPAVAGSGASDMNNAAVDSFISSPGDLFSSRGNTPFVNHRGVRVDPRSTGPTEGMGMFNVANYAPMIAGGLFQSHPTPLRSPRFEDGLHAFQHVFQRNPQTDMTLGQRILSNVINRLL